MKLKFLSLVILSTLLSACGGSSGGGSDDSTPSYHPQSSKIDIFADNASTITLTSVESSQIPALQNDPLQYGSLSLTCEDVSSADASSNMNNYSLVYTAPAHDDIAKLVQSNGCEALPETEEFSYSLTSYDQDGNETTIYNKVNIRLADELLKSQWHICNRGTSNIQDGELVKGADTNVVTSWLNHGTGANVDTFVIDSRIFKHEDISIADGRIYDVQDFKENEEHGTSVVGLIAARANTYGVRGMAYKTNLYHYDFANSTEQQVISAFRDVSNKKSNLRDDSKHHAKILSPLNMSFAMISNGMWSMNNGNTGVVERLVANDIVPLQAAGNSYYGEELEYPYPLDQMTTELIAFYDAVNDFNTDCRKNNVDCSFVYADGTSRSPSTIIIGAVGADGKHAQYSSSSPNMWISAPGGTSSVDTLPVATVTTDIAGCDFGLSYYDAPSIFDRGGLFNSNCNYTSRFAGTSAATPVASGAVANLLSADADNDITTIEQVKYLLYKTAKKNIPNDIAFVPGANLTVKTNAAGVKFSEPYGFGILDSGEATLAITTNKSDTTTDPDFIRRSEEPEEVALQWQDCTEIEDSDRLAKNNHHYRCTLGATNDTTYQIESIKFDFMDAKFSGNEFCNDVGSLRSAYQYIFDTDDLTYAYSALNLMRLMSISYTSSKSSNNHYMLKPHYMIFWGADDSVFNGDTSINANGLYLEEFTPEDKIHVYFGSDCKMTFPNNAVKATLRGYSLSEAE